MKKIGESYVNLEQVTQVQFSEYTYTPRKWFIKQKPKTKYWITLWFHGASYPRCIYVSKEEWNGWKQPGRWV